MTPAFTTRRRADEFDKLVEGLVDGTAADAPRDAELLALVGALRNVPPAPARPEFVADLRSRLMAEAESMPARADEARLVLPPRRSRRERRIAAVVGGLVAVGATSSVAVAAQGSLPGDVLYPLKRALENADAGLSASDRERGSTLISSASGRLAEVTALSEAGRGDDARVIADTLNTFAEQATEASDLLLADYAETGRESSIEELRDFTGASMASLERLETMVPVDARDELLHAARVIAQIDLEASRICPFCPGTGVADIPAILTSTTVPPVVEPLDTTSDDSKGSGDGKSEEPGLPQPGTSLPPGSILEPPTESETQGPGSGPGAGLGDDPVGDLTDDLTKGGKNTTKNGVPGLSGLQDTIDGITDGLDGTLN